RKVPYESVDSAAARELFIRHALVQMDYDSKAPFFVHNRQLLEEREYLQQKGRRVDLLVDEAVLEAFFQARVPPEATSGTAFEAWRRKAERADPKLLFLGEADVSGGAEGAALDPTRFPDHLMKGALRIALEYRFDPGHADDGVTALVPLHVLNGLRAADFDWLVPGLLEEKVAALIRSLPKQLRVLFVPVPAFAARALDTLRVEQGDLKAQLALALTRASGARVPVDAFRDEPLPVHLRMNFALVDESDRVVDRGRDLEALKARHGGIARRSFDTLARQALLHTGAKQWTFGDLPRGFDAEHEGRRVLGHVALVDEGETAGVRVFPTEDEASRSQTRGLTRLVRLSLGREAKDVRRALAVDVQAELAYRKLGEPPRDLRDDLVDAAITAVFVAARPDVRTAAAFGERLAAGRPTLAATAAELGRAVQQTLQALVGVRTALANVAAATRADVESQLAGLLPVGFVLSVPASRLRELPRYLKAVQQRLDKARQDPARDARLLRDLEPFETQLRGALQAAAKAGQPLSPTVDAFRWLLQEFRVSLFAQQLGTAVPVSAQRLSQAWAATTA
ncbi:DUF3418 domain-containing protein, partial [bacterium]